MTRRSFGPPGAPRLRLNPQFRNRCLDKMRDGLRSWAMAVYGGFPQPHMFSTRLHARRVKATATTIERFERVADLVGFPREEIFLHDEPTFTEIPPTPQSEKRA